MIKHFLLASSLLAMGVVSTGCASTAKGISQSALVSGAPSGTLTQEVPAGGLLAVIRYPAVVENDALSEYHRAYARRAIGGATGKGVVNSQEANAIADSAVVKSNYYALSLFKEMAARLPEHTVLLSPHAIKLDANGSLTSEPITSAETLPSVVSVDFATYSYPDDDKMMGDVPLTFGDLISPLVSVRTDHRAAAPTQGVLMGSAPLLSRAAAEGREAALDMIDGMQAGQLKAHVKELDFVSYITDDTPRDISTTGLSTTAGNNAAISLPVEKIQLNSMMMGALESAKDGSVDPLADVFSDPLARRVIELINGLDGNKAVMMGKAASVAEFDPSLAALTFVGSDDADYAARVAYAERLLDAQRKYLSVQSLRIFDGIHNGEMGAQMRDMITAEHGVMERRRQLAKQQNMATALAIAAAIGGGVAASKTGGDGNNYGNRVLTQIAVQSAVYAAQEAISLNRQSKAVGSNYLTSIVPALEQQTSVTVDLLGANETITAIRYEDLQAKLQTLYTNRQRSLDTVATRCAYLDDAGAKTGSWLGVCDGGLANGSGAGVLENGVEVMEYYGYAENGLANGPGLMIRHTPSGSVSYEGSFANGKPDGSVTVSKSGSPDATRNFSAGRDIGGSTQAAASPFDGRTGLAVN
mgnify:CR=1 FL=1